MEQYLSFVTLDVWTLIFTWVNLLILFFLVKKLFMKPVEKMLAERNAEIKNDYSEAENARSEADRMRTEYEEKLAAAHTEAEKIVSDALKGAKMRSDGIVKDAEEKATGMINAAEKNIKAATAVALSDIKGEIGQMAVEIARKLIEKDIDKKDHERLIDKALEGFGDLSE